MFASGAALFRRRASSAMRRCSFSDAPSWPARFSSSASASERTGPPPIRVSLTESAGRGVFATREIAAGELIHSANPLVVHPSLSLLDKVCYYCLGRLHEPPSPLGSSAVEENDSSKTAASYFCSESCREQSKVFFEIERRLDWSSFHQYCSLKRLKYPLMVKRLACMVISGAASIDSLDILQPASLHPEIIAEMDEEFQLLEDTFQLGQFKNDMTFLTKEWYINALARIRINAFRIELVARSYEEMLSSAVAFIAVDAAVGNAVYMLPSFYNHDCDPNTHIIWIDNANAKLKALRHIEEGSFPSSNFLIDLERGLTDIISRTLTLLGEELRICYIDTSMAFEARQKILGEGFGFQCRCLRCLSHE